MPHIILAWISCMSAMKMWPVVVRSEVSFWQAVAFMYVHTSLVPPFMCDKHVLSYNLDLDNCYYVFSVSNFMFFLPLMLFKVIQVYY